MKWFKYSMTAIAGLLFLTVFFSPFKKQGQSYRMIKTSTIINASPCEVFNYLGNSDNAKRWSSFVSHIKPLRGKDGTIGSFRRCFKDAAEKNEQWDEEIVTVDQCKKRRLTIFNLQNFPVTANGLVTEQIYEWTEEGKCKLSFTLFFDKEHNTYWQQFKMAVFGHYIKNIFDKNLENINRFTSKNSLTTRG